MKTAITTTKKALSIRQSIFSIVAMGLGSWKENPAAAPSSSDNSLRSHKVAAQDMAVQALRALRHIIMNSDEVEIVLSL